VIRADRDGFCTTEIVPLKANAAVESGYLFYWLRHPRFLDYVTSVSHGLNMPRLGTVEGRRAPFVLAPRNEQHRIADKLDAVLARVDTCRARLDRVPAILKRFREAVLEAAVSGRLTEEWRAKHPTVTTWLECVRRNPPSLPDSYRRLAKRRIEIVPVEHSAANLPLAWSVQTIAALYEAKALIDFADGNHGSAYPRKEDFSAVGVPFVTAQQITDSHLVDLRSSPRLRKSKAESLVKGWATQGDVLLTHNATVGRVSRLENTTEPVLLGTSVTFYRFNERYVSARYAMWVFASSFFQRQLAGVMSQTTRDQVPITMQVSLHFICPPVEEQQEIARRVDELFTLADGLEAKHRAAMERVERLTPAVLAKAFRGELVPQDPGDEPASVMLERIRAQRPVIGAPASSRSRETAASVRSVRAAI
jgi:type I restriction enzyme, S subunit